VTSGGRHRAVHREVPKRPRAERSHARLDERRGDDLARARRRRLDGKRGQLAHDAPFRKLEHAEHVAVPKLQLGENGGARPRVSDVRAVLDTQCARDARRQRRHRPIVAHDAHRAPPLLDAPLEIVSRVGVQLREVCGKHARERPRAEQNAHSGPKKRRNAERGQKNEKTQKRARKAPEESNKSAFLCFVGNFFALFLENR